MWVPKPNNSNNIKSCLVDGDVVVAVVVVVGVAIAIAIAAAAAASAVLAVVLGNA